MNLTTLYTSDFDFKVYEVNVYATDVQVIFSRSIQPGDPGYPGEEVRLFSSATGLSYALDDLDPDHRQGCLIGHDYYYIDNSFNNIRKFDYASKLTSPFASIIHGTFHSYPIMQTDVSNTFLYVLGETNGDQLCIIQINDPTIQQVYSIWEASGTSRRAFIYSKSTYQVIGIASELSEWIFDKLTILRSDSSAKASVLSATEDLIYSNQGITNPIYTKKISAIEIPNARISCSNPLEGTTLEFDDYDATFNLISDQIMDLHYSEDAGSTWVRLMYGYIDHDRSDPETRHYVIRDNYVKNLETIISVDYASESLSNIIADLITYMQYCKSSASITSVASITYAASNQSIRQILTDLQQIAGELFTFEYNSANWPYAQILNVANPMTGVPSLTLTEANCTDVVKTLYNYTISEVTLLGNNITSNLKNTDADADTYHLLQDYYPNISNQTELDAIAQNILDNSRYKIYSIKCQIFDEDLLRFGDLIHITYPLLDIDEDFMVIRNATNEFDEQYVECVNSYVIQLKKSIPSLQQVEQKINTLATDVQQNGNLHSNTATYSRTAFTLATTTEDELDFDTEVVNDAGYIWSSGTNPNRVYVPKAGYYFCTARVRFSTNATGTRQLRFSLNGINKFIIEYPGNASITSGGCISQKFYVPAGQWVGIHIYQNSGGNLTVTAELDIEYRGI